MFGSHIKKLREAKGLTQAELSNMMNRDQQSIQRVEKGRVSPSIFFLYELSEALDIKLKDLTDFKY
ncbi:MAG: helix-turn-helix transcriptional regulator [Bacteroidetes bacterium]|nr:helix-turn-helix transcriptional regulator [Bacteroidota bacterium]